MTISVQAIAASRRLSLSDDRASSDRRRRRCGRARSSHLRQGRALVHTIGGRRQ